MSIKLAGPLGAMALLLAAGAGAQEFRDPEWIGRPDGETFMRYYPQGALNQGVVGRVILDCVIQLDTTAPCEVVEETPLGWGIGEAALGISQSFRLRPAEQDGRPVAGARVRVPVRFHVSQPDEESWVAAVYDSVPQAARVELPVWADAPNADAVAAAYPPAARAAGLVGRGTLACLINSDRTLDCALDHERPEGQGFGAAALSLAARFVIHESQGDYIAAHAGQRIYLPVLFGAPPDMTPLSLHYSGRGPFSVRLTAPPHIPRVGVSAALRCVMHTPAAPVCAVERQTAPWPGIDTVRANIETPEGGVGFVPGDEVLVEIEF
ncbi:MAG TPA: energy transducer TonB [Terricaulis sp.]|nr:energy transducer TonB [Terricaulis sp.]